MNETKNTLTSRTNISAVVSIIAAWAGFFTKTITIDAAIAATVMAIQQIAWRQVTTTPVSISAPLGTKA